MARPAPQVGETIAGKYRVESVLGRGGMGVVYAARHAISERRVAVKWMEADVQDEPDALERFVREARAMGRIEHPNVVGVLDVGTEGAAAYLVMEILRGESLRAMLTREGKLPAELALKTLLPVLEGVEAAHRAGVVHRDLKPENLFVVRGANGEAVTTKVLDFGISKLTEHDAKTREAKRLTKTGHVVGTPTYMAPEQVRGGAVDARTDVWALATILYEMLAADTPFDGDNYGALLVAIAVEPYKPLDPKLVPPDLARVVHKGLAKEPEDRWQSVLEFARALEPFARGAKFAEPRRPSLVPSSPAERESPAATLAAGRAPAEIAPPAIAAATPATPELQLDLPPRASGAAAAPASPTPIRLVRGSAPSATETSEALAPSPSRRALAVGAIALAVVVALVLVIRGIGNAARDAAFATPPAAVLPPPAPPAPPPTTTVAIAPPPSVAPPPPATPTPTLVEPPPATHVRRAEIGARPHTPPATTTSAGAPPTTTTTTGASRSGSISREDF